MTFSAREKKLLQKLFSPGSVARLVKEFPGTSESDWERIHDKLATRPGSFRRTNGLALYVDGASDPATGTAGIGGVLYEKGERGTGDKEILTFSDNIGRATNNEAEYRALISGLERASEVSTGHLEIFSDSELIVNQVNVEYKVKSDRLIRLYFKSKKLLDRFESWEIHHVPRGKNRKADILSKQALKIRTGS